MSVNSFESQREFLPGFELRLTKLPVAEGLSSRGLILGKATNNLEIAIYDSASRPRQDIIRKLWRERWKGRAIPLLTIVLYGDKSGLCGHTEQEREAPPVYFDLDIQHVERLCSSALKLPDHHSVDRFLRDQIPETESSIFGIKNHGLLATYVIQRGKEEIPELWDKAYSHAASIAAKNERQLFSSLGYTIEELSGPASILTAKESRIALAIFLDQTELAEVSSKRFGGQTPISYAINLAQSHNLKWVVVCRGSELRLYPTSTEIGVGRRGLTDSYLQINTELLTEERKAFLWLAFSSEALASRGLFDLLLEKSDRYAIDVGQRLRDRIYTIVIPQLAKSIVNARKLRKPSAEDLQLTYQMAMLVLFRLLFMAYAEDHDLLPYKTNAAYRARSLTQKAKELKQLKESGTGFDKGTSQWDEIKLLWKAVREGNSEWGIPPYNGGLFDEDSHEHSAGTELAKIQLSNREFGLILSELLLDDKTPEGLGPVDFRSLGVREFGTIYEGLLENELSVAETDLVTDRKAFYKPAKEGTKPEVEKGEIYLHNKSGARKASGSYYTKSFAVDHLLDNSLEPAIDEHLERVKVTLKTSPDNAVQQLFEFYVADIAMGSGHFLISAIDRIEKRFLLFLADHPLPGLDAELEKLRDAARRKLGETADERWLERNKLLRRLIARRCIYGVDLNPLAVELARLSVWIHTFVPGLPLSFLDHNLVCGNSLVGIGTLDEVKKEFLEENDQFGLFDDIVKRMLGEKVDKIISSLRAVSDCAIEDIEELKRLRIRLRSELTFAESICDIVAAARVDKDIKDKESLLFQMGKKAAHRFTSVVKSLGELSGGRLLKRAQIVLKEYKPFHFPVAFPEIFLRERQGFDVIIGNPPWEEATVEEYAFWARHFPGLRGMSATDQTTLQQNYRKERPDLVNQLQKEIEEAELLRKVLTSGPYPGMGTGDPDVYKAFCWRFWNLVCEPGGRIGVVLPRSVWFTKGSSQFRIKCIKEGELRDLTYLLNNRKWIFDEVHPQYTIVLSSIEKTKGSMDEKKIGLQGPFRSLDSFIANKSDNPLEFSSNDVLEWTDTASLPLLPSEESGEVFLQMRKAPRLNAEIGEWKCRPHTEIHATNDRGLMIFEDDQPEGCWPVYKGESFDIWNPDTGRYYAWVEPDSISRFLLEKRKRASLNRRSAFSLFSKKWVDDSKTLPCLHARIAYRQVSRATDTRTLRVTLIPPNVVLPNFSPYLLWPTGNEKHQAYLLGILASIPLDWYARRFVEENLSKFLFESFPILRSDLNNQISHRIIEVAGRLACPDKRFAEWAKRVGVEYGPIPEDEKDDMIAELDAVVAHLYALNEKQLRHIFETFHEGWDFEPRMNAVLGHYKNWKKKL